MLNCIVRSHDDNWLFIYISSEFVRQKIVLVQNCHSTDIKYRDLLSFMQQLHRLKRCFLSLCYTIVAIAL